jgi:hypothetical protein
LKEFKKLRKAAAFVLASSAGAFAADCTPIETPSANTGLETFKQLFFDGRYADAVAPFELSDETKQNIVTTMTSSLGDRIQRCVTIKRASQSEHWVSEIIMYDAGPQLIYIVVSGEQRGDAFRMVNFWATGDFGAIREMMY